MSRLEAIQAFVDEVRGLPGYTLTRVELERAEEAIDEHVERELRDEHASFVLDDEMRAWWSEIAHVRVEWEGPRLADGLSGGGVLWVPSVFDVVRPAFVERELDAMAPSSDAERALLLELHHLALHDGGHWSALRVREHQPPEVWYRTTRADGRAPLDVCIGTMARYTETLMQSRGADRWQSLLVDLDALSEADAEAMARYEAPVLIRALEALKGAPSARADAEALLERAHALRDHLR